MIILLDIGNSRLKWASLEDKTISAMQSFVGTRAGIKGALTKQFKQLKNVEQVFVANVAGDKLAEQLTDWTLAHWEVEPVFVDSEKRRFGVTNGYASAQKLGIDRWLNLVAAREQSKKTTTVIDCGTAITIDTLDDTGKHLGGLILPGLALMRQSLINGTDALNPDTDKTGFNMLATNTYTAVQTGTLYSVIATLESIISDLQQQSPDSRFILTGGDSHELASLLPDHLLLQPDLVLRGLARYARAHLRSQKQKQPRKTGSQAAEKLPAETN